MRKIIFFVAFAAISCVSNSQSLGYQNLSLMFSRNDGNGSARFVAMGGAFGAVGGDVTSIIINPAGISVFNGNNASLTFQARNTNYLTTYYNNSLTTEEDFFKVTNAGAVLTFENNFNNEKVYRFSEGRRCYEGGSVINIFNFFRSFFTETERKRYSCLFYYNTIKTFRIGAIY